jgi:hypothetical protein
MQTMKSPLTQIRSTAIAKANRLQSLAQHLQTLRPAFRAWLNGHIYIGGRGRYRYRSDRSLAPWSNLANELFPTVADFAFAAATLDSIAMKPTAPTTKAAPAKAAGRVNVIALAKAA